MLCRAVVGLSRAGVPLPSSLRPPAVLYCAHMLCLLLPPAGWQSRWPCTMTTASAVLSVLCLHLLCLLPRL